MSGGNLFEADHNGLKFMRHSDWRMGLLFAGFVLTMLVFDKILHTIEHHIRDDPTKQGLRHAVKRFKTELLAVGVVSLLLVALTEPLTKICLPDSNHHSSSSNVHLASDPASHSSGTSHTPAPGASHTPTKSTPAAHTPPTTAHKPPTAAHTPPTPAHTSGHSPSAGSPHHHRHQFRHLLSSGSSSSHESSCNQMFDEHTIHNAHLLLFLIAIVNIFFGVATLLIGVLSVEHFRRRPSRLFGLLPSNRPSFEADVADDDYLKPLKHSLAKDIERHGHSTVWRLWWAFKRQFKIIGDERVVTKDLYMATRSCAFDFLNTVHFHVMHGGKVRLPAGQALSRPHLPCTRASPKDPAAAGPVAAAAADDTRRAHDQAAAATEITHKLEASPATRGLAGRRHDPKAAPKAAGGRLHRLHAQRHMDFVGLVHVAVEIVFTKETNSEWILPLLLAVLFAVPHTPVLLMSLVTLQLLVNVVVGIKMQCILLHMAIRYHHKRGVWQRWLNAKKVALQAAHKTNGSALPPTPGDHAIVPIQTAPHERAPIEHFHKGLTKDGSTLFWFGWPDMVRLMMQISYFTNSLVLALLLFVAWQGRKQEPRIFQETWRFWTYSLSVTAVSFFHLSFMVMPAYALLTTTGRHVPLELIQAMRHPGALNALYAIRRSASEKQ